MRMLFVWMLATALFIVPCDAAPPSLVKLRVPQRSGVVSVRGHVGGEAHDSYAIGLKAGQRVTVTLTARGGQAEFLVSESPDFAEAQPASIGKDISPESWTATVAETRIYYVYVTAHPLAHYRLKVTVKPSGSPTPR